MATLSLKNINKVYPNNVKAVVDFSMDINEKDFICLVGPSGCGKSTTLKMIAGLESISSGELYINDELMNNVKAKDRNISMVFQSYALYSNMTVYDNIAFGLKLHKTPQNEIDEKVLNAAKILSIENYLKRKPNELSGGQRQRVALARAIVKDSCLFLYDEPLSNLDAKLRAVTKTEIVKLHRKLGSTTIYVTHDQIEAMTMADKVVIMKDGYVQQIATPKVIYETPYNVFVGEFIGSPSMNFIEGFITDKGIFTSKDNIYEFILSKDKFDLIKKEEYLNKPVIFGIRAEDIHDKLSIPKDSNINTNNYVNIVCEVVENLGPITNIYTTVNNTNISATIKSREGIKHQSELQLVFDVNKCHIFDSNTKINILYNPK
ncbi:MAG: ABC transporter ATP-binding protein [Anaeroplasmataceae bacterium]